MRTHDQTVQDQFDPRAQSYLESPVHTAGPDLAHAQSLVAAAAPRTATLLDIGCGAGHLSFALAPAVGRVISFDPSEGMLEVLAAAAKARGLSQIETRRGSAEGLPFTTRELDLVCTRFSAHHWMRLETAIAEMARVVKPSGYVLIIDTMTSEDALVDTHLQTMEVLRDPSHVRNRSVTQWRKLLGASGLVEIEHRSWPLRLEFKSWTERMRTTADRVAMIRALQRDAPREVQEALACEADGSFTVQVGLFWARPGG